MVRSTQSSHSTTVPAAAHEKAVRATHIVLFRQKDDADATAQMRSVLALKPTTGVRDANGVATFASAAGDARAIVYRRMGVAAIVATPAQASEIKSDPAVEDVFVNEVRSIPRPVPLRAMRASSPAEAPGLDYLTGLRDGLQVAIEALTGRREFPSTPARAPVPIARDAGDMTWGLRAIGLMNDGPYTGRGVKLAVLDTGIDLRHPDLQGRVEEGTTARSFVAGQSVQDGHGHGTHCCGTAAGPARSVGGIRYGVAPGVQLLVGKVLSDDGDGWDDDIIDGIQWAESQGARIISMSIGSPREMGAPYSRLYERLAQRLLSGTPGVLLVAAAGNESERPAFTKPVGNPAACPSIQAVGAVDQNMAVAFFSCRQMDGIGRVDLCGPGVGVRSAAAGGGFIDMSGTSMATPHVAGAAALYFEATPGATAAEVWDRLVADTRALGDAADFGAGIVQVPKVTS